MATFKSKQLNPNLTGSFAVSGSFGVTGPLTATTFVGMISGSAQIASDISGSFTDVSASFSTRITNATASIAGLIADSGSISTRLTTEEANVDALQVDSGSFSVRVTDTETTASSLINDFSKVQSLGTTDSVIFDAINTTGDVTVQGNIIAETYIVSSSITRLTSSFSSGSTIFGDTIDDTHQFTGSAFISGSLTAVNLVADSGSFSTRTTTLEAASASFSTRVTTEESNVDVLQARNINTGLGLSGGGNLTGDRTLAIDFSDSDFQTGISGSFTSPSASFSTRLTTAEDELNNTLISSSAQISTDISGSLGDNADLIRTLTAASISGSSGFAAALSPAIVSGSWQGALSGSLNVISGSATSTGSFGRIEVDVVEAQRFVISSSVTNITTIDVSGSTNFGDSSDDRHSFTGSLFIPSGSLEGEVYIDTNESKMFIGKYSGGIVVSGSANASRYVTAGDGSLIDLGFTSVDDSGVTVLTTIGDGIHSDSNNYWYNNNFFKVGSNSKYVQYDPGLNTLKARGELEATTGSYFGEMHINNQQGSMFVGKNSKGIPVSGSANMSRFVTGSDGSVVDIGFITVDEDGNENFLTTGDGLVRDANNYWYNTGHFKLGDANQYIQWDNTNLTISGSSSSTASFGFYANISASVAAAGFGSGGGGGSSFTAAGISGSFTSVSASLSARLTSEEGEAEGSVVSSSAQLATDISGSFTSVSSSLAARITVEEAEGGGGGSFTAAGISGSFQGGGSNLISGSSTSTGSFGRVQVSSGKVFGVSTSGVSTPFNIVGGTSTSAGGLKIGAYNASFGGLWSGAVTPATSNYALVANATRTVLNATSDIAFFIGDSTNNFYMNSTGVGIGNTSPARKLDVSGTGRFTDTLTTAAITTTGITSTGNISGSSTSTGSFGKLEVSDTATIGGKLSLPNISNVSASLAAAVAGGDNLGNHTATQDINLDSNSIKNILHVTASGNISGSATSTGSFGRVEVNGTELTSSPITALNNATENELVTVGATTTELDAEANLTFASGKLELSGVTYPNIRVVGSQLGYVLIGDTGATSNFQNYQLVSDGGNFEVRRVNDGVNSVLETPFKISSDKVEVLNISGSATSTGSFGKLFGDGSEITNVTATAPTGTVSGSAQLSTAISGSFTSTSASFSTRLTTRESYLTQSFSDGTAALISGSATSTGSFQKIDTRLDGRIIGNLTELIKVTVVSDGGNHYAFEGATTPSLQVSEGKTYRFDISDSTVGSHPFRFSTVQDGSHNGGSAYTTGVIVAGTQGQAGAYVELQVTKATVNHLYYYCTAHGGMGNDGKIMKNDLTNLHMVSGSATSTGSFGMVLGDGSGLTNLPSTPAFPFTGSATISGSFSIDTGDGKVFEVSNETGSLFSVTDASGVPALETLDDRRTVGRFERPMSTHLTNFTASVLYGGFYNIVSGDLTCSIIHPDTASVAVGTEFEFFQNDGDGHGFLFQTQSMGTTQVLSKNGNMQLAGQYSGATLKKVDTDTWHLVGDLT